MLNPTHQFKMESWKQFQKCTILYDSETYLIVLKEGATGKIQEFCIRKNGYPYVLEKL